jgi:beta-lactamase regulating signal transducer with metallopeptidase domain
MLALLVGAALRSLVLAAAVWLVLRMLALRNTRLHLTAWTIVLTAALLMPVGAEVASALLPPAPAPAAITFVLGQGIGTSRQDIREVTPEGSPGLSATPAPERDVVPMTARPAPAMRWPAWQTWALLAYVTVCCGLFARLAAGLIMAARVARAARPVNESWTRGHDVRLSDAIGAPATFGPIILLPPDCATWPLIKRTAVIAHEAAHVERHDFHVQLAANLHRAIFWFSPLSWWLRRKLADLAEAACDEAAIFELQDRSAYAAILLDISGNAPELPAYVAMARPATLRARVRRILAGTEARTSAAAYHHALMIGCLVPLVALATFPVTAIPLSEGFKNGVQQVPLRRIAIDLRDAYGGYYKDMESGSLMMVTRDGDHPYTDHDFFPTEPPVGDTPVTNRSGAASTEEVRESVSTGTAEQRKAQYDRYVAEEMLPHTAIDLNADVLADYVGDYQVSPTIIIAITREGTQLFAQTIGEQRFPVFPYTDRDFFYTSAAAQITFVKSANDPASALILHKDGMDRIGPRVSLETAEQMQRRWDDEQKLRVRIPNDDALLDRYVGRYDHLVVHIPDFPSSIVYPLAQNPVGMRIPTELANAPRNIRFVTSPHSVEGGCVAGIRLGGSLSLTGNCEMSIDECLAIPGSHIGRNFNGDWRCVHE